MVVVRKVDVRLDFIDVVDDDDDDDDDDTDDVEWNGIGVGGDVELVPVNVLLKTFVITAVRPGDGRKIPC